MNDKKFVDSNVFLYLVRDEKGYKEKALEILLSKHIINPQVIGENIFVCRKKFLLSPEESLKHAEYLIEKCSIVPTTIDTLQISLHISRKYQYTIWDSLLLASALENNCTVFYSEDMQHNQVIEKSLTIINPFR